MEEQLTLLDRAILFAVKAHAGAVRRDGHTPYILHCTEAAAIAATMTQEQEVLAAAVLHDVVEDTDVTAETLESEFGSRVALLVGAMSENKRPDLPPRRHLAGTERRNHCRSGGKHRSGGGPAVSGR